MLLTSPSLFLHLFYAFSQGQENGSDCGVFAIAFAMAICNTQNPEELKFHILKMRRCLFECLEDKQMHQLPSNQHQYCQTVCKTENVPVYCKCRLQEEGNMICCEGCGTWYHSTCDNIPKTAWAKESTWLCSSCNH